LSSRERFPLTSCPWLFRTQLACTISAPGQHPAPMFWAADASSTIPKPPQAYADSLQPNRNNSWDRTSEVRNEDYVALGLSSPATCLAVGGPLLAKLNSCVACGAQSRQPV